MLIYICMDYYKKEKRGEILKYQKFKKHIMEEIKKKITLGSSFKDFFGELFNSYLEDSDAELEIEVEGIKNAENKGVIAGLETKATVIKLGKNRFKKANEVEKIPTIKGNKSKETKTPNKEREI